MKTVGAAVLGGLALLGASGTAAATPQQSTAPLEAKIAVTQTPDDQQVGCLPGSRAMTYATEHTASTFTLRITVSAPLCQPVTATAAAYAMPGDGVAWPQELIEFTTFTLDAAGRTEVTFTKTCQPAQFDILTGAVPQTIAPWGASHGTLLFPYDVNTAHQHWGGACEPAPTTTTTSTTTTTAAPLAATSSTLPPTSTTTTTAEVLSVSDEQPPNGGRSTPTPTAGPEVLGATEEAEPAALAFTGLGFSGMAVGGAVLLLVGLALAESARRRSLAEAVEPNPGVGGRSGLLE